MERFKSNLLKKYRSKYMKNLVETSPIFHDETTQIYRGLKNGKWDLSGINGRLLEGRIGEIKFGKNLFFGKLFKYMGDHDLYTFTTDDYTFNYSSIDFQSDFGVAVDVKMLGPTAIRMQRFASGREHMECVFNIEDIDKYLNSAKYPFLLMYNDHTFYNNCHTMFVDLRTAYDVKDIVDSLFKVKIEKNNHYVYRINIEYMSSDNQKTHYLLNHQEFAQFVINCYNELDDQDLICKYNELAKTAGYLI